MYSSTKSAYIHLILFNLFRNQYNKLNSKLLLIINSQPHLKKSKSTGIYYKDSHIYLRKFNSDFKYSCLPPTVCDDYLKKELDEIYTLNINLETEYAKINSILINAVVCIKTIDEFKTFILKVFKSLDVLNNTTIEMDFSNFKSCIENADAKPLNKKTSEFFKANPDSIKELTACYFKSKLMG